MESIFVKDGAKVVLKGEDIELVRVLIKLGYQKTLVPVAAEQKLDVKKPAKKKKAPAGKK